MTRQRSRARRRGHILRLGLAIALVLAIVLLLFQVYAAKRLSRRSEAATFHWPRMFGKAFLRCPLPITDYRFFDFGVVDFNGDGRLDLFSSNHAFRDILLANLGPSGFADVSSAWGFDQERAFPGLADTGREPTIDVPGLYLYWHQRRFVVRSHQMEENDLIQGSLAFYSPCQVTANLHFDVQLKPRVTESGATHTTVTFKAGQDGLLALDVKMVGIRMTFDLNDQIPLSKVYVGSKRLTPSAHQFQTLLRDRHGMAWADYDGDDRMDVYVTRGGLMGVMDRIPEEYRDELLMNGGNRFDDRAEAARLEKKASRGRGVASVDFNGDGRLDIYVNCQGGPDQLHRQEADGTFTDVAGDLGLNRVETDGFIWFDADDDGDSDLLLRERRMLQLFVNQDGSFQRQSLGEGGKTMAISDYDYDGDLDVFVIGHDGSLLLRNAGGGYFERVNAKELGLPTTGAAVCWVDFDNDGLMDLFSMPGDLYRQTENRVFEATGLIVTDDSAGAAMCSWFDADNDGRRDLIMACAVTHNTPHWPVAFYRNVGQTGHWLEIDLVGPPGNRQAIGARVYVTTRHGTRLAQVGESESSAYSQGHYRLYFGLGDAPQPEMIRVTWPDGSTQALRRPPGDQVLTIRALSSGAAKRP